MKSLSVLATALVAIMSVSANASSTYQCKAKANPSRGFNSDFTIALSPAANGGKIILTAGAKKKVLGVISETATVKISDEAFQAVLGLLQEEDISGVPASEIDSVDSIETFMSGAHSELETVVYKLFSKNKQIGGSIVISAMGTACLP